VKRIGTTDDGYIVTISDNEHNIFSALQAAVGGETYFSWEHRGRRVDMDLEPALLAISEWVKMKMKINDLKESISDLEAVLENKES
jgi:hypothetical protein